MITPYTASNGLPGELVNAATLTSGVSSGTGTTVSDPLTLSLPAPPTPDGNAFQSTSAAINIQIRNQWTVLTQAWYTFYIDLRLAGAASVGDSLNINFQDPINPVRPASLSYNCQVSVGSLSPTSYTTISGTFPIFDDNDPDSPNAQTLIVSGTVANGLYIARVRVEQQVAEPHLMQVQAGKLLYSLTDTGYVTANISNLTGSTVSPNLKVTLYNEFDGASVVYNSTVSIPPGANAYSTYPVIIPLGLMIESGYEVAVNLTYGAINETGQDFFYVSNYPARFGHCVNVNFGSSIYQQNNTGTLNSARGDYFNICEVDFWAPDDTLCQGLPNIPSSDPPPYSWQYWGGQTLPRVATGGVADTVAYAHTLGIKCISYSNLRFDYGFLTKEYFRQNPQYCNWDDHSGYQNWGVAAVDQQADESDSQRFNTNGSTNFGPSGLWSMNCGDPGFISYHASQIQQAMLLYGFDGVRYDDLYVYDYPTVNMLGQVLPYPNYDNTDIVSHVRSSLHSVNPFAIVGHNTVMWQGHWIPDTAMPASNTSFRGDYYTELAYCEGIILQEQWSDQILGGYQWSTIAGNLALIGYNAWRFGGNAYFITAISSGPSVDQRLVAALILSSFGHLYGSGTSVLLPYLQLACRYSRLIWGKNVVSLQGAGVSITSSNGIWTQNASLALSSPRILYYAHIVNQPTNSTSGSSTLQGPASVNLTWNLPDTSVTAAWVISADSNPTTQRTYGTSPWTTVITDSINLQSTKTPVSFSQTGSTVSLSVVVTLWSIVILDCNAL